MNRNRITLPAPFQSQGFTLIEVLVAIVVLAIGLLGMAGLQALGLQNNNTAYLRSQATFLAYELADRMRANNAAGNGYYSTVTGTEGSPNTDCGANVCNQLEMSQYDIYHWQQSINEYLPMGKGTVSRDGLIHTIIISWDDNRNGVVDTSASCDSSDPLKDPCFKLSVQP